jgi:hypothetical protein
VRRTKNYCPSVQATHAVLLSFTRKTCTFRLYRIVFGELYSNLSCLARQSFLLFTELASKLTVFDTDYIFEYCTPMAMHPTLLFNFSYQSILLVKGRVLALSNSLGLYFRYVGGSVLKFLLVQ